MNKLYLIRGLPGTGKSTLARDIALVVCEADQFFMVNGLYQFDASRLSDAHEWCKYICQGHMTANTFTIAVANTFVYRHHMQPYFDLAVRYNYQVTEITMSGPMHMNTHNVPVETINRMRENWEK